MAVDRKIDTLDPAARRGFSAGQLVALALWLAALGGFALYLSDFDSFEQTYGSVGASCLSLAWLAMFALLYYATPDLRPARTTGPRREPDLAGRNGRLEGSRTEPERPDRPLTAQSPLEAELAEWGFAYGVAWAFARSRDPHATDDLVAERALAAANPAFEESARREQPARARAPQPGTVPGR